MRLRNIKIIEEIKITQNGLQDFENRKSITKQKILEEKLELKNIMQEYKLKEHEIKVYQNNVTRYASEYENKKEVYNLLLEETAKKSNESEINKFLFDLRQAPNKTPVGIHHDFVYNKSRNLGFRPGSKHALLISPESREDYSFLELILSNAGYKSKMFEDEKEAVEWVEK